MAIVHRRPVLTMKHGLAAFVVLVTGIAGCAQAAPLPTTGPTTPTTQPAPTVAKSAPSPSPLPAVKPSPGLVPSVTASPSASASPSPAVSAAVAPRPANATLQIAAPTAGQTLPAGPVQVRVTYSGPPLVPVASATALDQYHLHYLLDVSAAPYVGTLVPVPLGDPRIVHTAATEVQFDNVSSGSHTVTLMLSGSDHISVNPALSDQVTFTVS